MRESGLVLNHGWPVSWAAGHHLSLLEKSFSNGAAGFLLVLIKRPIILLEAMQRTYLTFSGEGHGVHLGMHVKPLDKN